MVAYSKTIRQRTKEERSKENRKSKRLENTFSVFCKMASVKLNTLSGKAPE
jgi:hypothetical protein